MERIASGYGLAEAPVAMPDGGVVFSDVLGGGVHRWTPTTGAVETVIPKRRGIGGMATHADGGLIVAGRDISHVGVGGESRILYAPDREAGVIGLNDLTVDPDGRIVVGHLHFQPFTEQRPVPGEFVTVDGATTSEVVAGIEWANGCGFSPDGATFYGCDYERGVVVAADRRDGGYGPSRIAVTSPSGDVDGMAVDETGALWVALGAGGAVGRFTPDGRLDGQVEVPANFVASLCFGGSDGRDLFITTADNTQDPDAGGAVFHTRVEVAGAPLTPATI